jgi:hypothetical protein
VSLLLLAGLGIQDAETQVAVRLQRAHTEFLSQCESLAVVGGGLFGLWGMALCYDLAKEAQGPGLVAVLVMLAADFNRMPSLVQGVLDPSGVQIPFAQRDDANHMVQDDSHGGGLLHHPL